MDSRQEFLNIKALRIVYWGLLHCEIKNLIGMKPFTGLFFRFVRPAGRTTLQPISSDWASA